MGLFRRYRYDDALYLMPIRLGNEQLPEGKIRMLCCDAKGQLNSALIDKSAYELAKSNARKMKRTRKNFATLGVEIAPGRTEPFAVEIGYEQVWALDNTLNHAIKRRTIPDILKKYLKQIVELGEAKRKEFKKQQEKVRDHAPSKVTPSVLYRLPYYAEDDIEATIPIYKAEQSYPLIILQRLPANEQTPANMQRVLILDSDGDLAIIRVPLELIDQAEKDLEGWEKANGSDACLIYSRNRDGFIMSNMAINELQRKSLEAIARQFEKKGHGEHPVSRETQAVLAKAQDMISSMDS